MMRSSAILLRFVLCLMAAVLVTGCSKQARVQRSLDRARGFYDAGEYEKAKVEYLSIIQTNRRQAEAFSQLGRIWSLQGSMMQAYPYLRRARELGQLPDELRPALMRAMVGTGQMADAQQEAREILKRNPADPDALRLLADNARTPEQVAAVWQEFEALPDRESAAYRAASVPLLLRMNRLFDAETAAARALELDPKLGAAHLAKAALCQAANDLPGLESALRTASGLAPARSMERLRFAEFIKQQGRPEAAREWVDSVLREVPDYIPALLFSAQLSADGRDFEAARSGLEKIFALDSNHPQARLLQADVLLAGGDTAGAVAALQRLERLFEESTEIRMKLARAHLQAGQLSEAADLLNGILTKKPDLTEASMLLAVIHLRQGNPAAAVAVTQAVLERDAGQEEAAFTLALALEAQRRFEEAAGVMRRLVEKSPENPVFQIRLGQLLAQAGQLAEARTIFERVRAGAPDREEPLSLLVDLDIREGQLDDALRRIAGWREGHPESVWAAFTEGRVHLMAQRLEPAEAALRRALELQAGHAGAMELLVRLYAMSGRLPEAMRVVQERLQQTPDDLAGLNLLALISMEQKDHGKAAEAYEKLRAVLPQPSPSVLNNLAILYAEHLGRRDRALELARQARELRPSVAAAPTEEARQEAAIIADTLGRILYLEGRLPEAMALADEAVAQLGDNPEVQAHFGLVAAASGRTEQAKAALARAVESQVDFSTKDEARQRLALLNGDASTELTSAALGTLVAQSPSDPVLQSRWAEALEKENKPAEAAAAHEAALKLNPQLAPAALRLAELYAGPLQDAEKAFGFAKTARDLAPGDRTITALLGRLAYRNGEYQWSYDLLSEASREGLRSAAVLWDLGRAAYSVGRVEEARTAADQALQASPPLDPEGAAEAREFLKWTAVPGPDEALAREALARDPRHVPALMVVGSRRLEAGEAAAAVAAWRQVLSIYPDSALAGKHLARVLSRDSGSRIEAYDLATKARLTLPDDPELTETFAILVHHRKDHPYAVDLFEEAARSRPLGADGLFCLGVSQLAVGDTEAGRTSLTRAVAAGLRGPEADEAARLLEEKTGPQ